MGFEFNTVGKRIDCIDIIVVNCEDALINLVGVIMFTFDEE